MKMRNTLVCACNMLVCARARFSPRVRVLPRAAAGQALPTVTKDRPWTVAEPGPAPGLRHPDPAARMSCLAPPRRDVPLHRQGLLVTKPFS